MPERTASPRPPVHRVAGIRRPRRTAAIAAVSVAAVAAAVVATTVPSASAAALFSDTFDGGGAGWSKSGGSWSVVTDGSKAFRQAKADSELARVFAGQSGWTDYAVQARVKPLTVAGTGLVAVAARATGATSMYRLALTGAGRAELQSVKGSTTTVLGAAPLRAATGTWYTLKLEASGTALRGFVDGRLVATGTATLSPRGRLGLVTVHASATFDDVTANTVAPGPTPPAATPAKPPTSSPPASPTSSPPAKPTNSPPTPPKPTPPQPTPPQPTPPQPSPPAPPGNGAVPAWPTATGEQRISTTIAVGKAGFDGELKRFSGIGDGSQNENQPPMFKLADGATLSNVIIGAPAGDGVHCSGSCRLVNVWWEDVGEDAATFRGGAGSVFTVEGGGARGADDKVFQHNGGGTVTIKGGFQIGGFGKLYRSCGNCDPQPKRTVVIQDVFITAPGKMLAGVNSNFGDTAQLSRITVIGDPARKMKICARFQGLVGGGEPKELGSGPDPRHCLYRDSDITYR